MNRFNIGRRIEAYRDRMKMSTQELAGRIRRSQATISRIENGKQGLTFELLALIADELRVHPFALLSDDPPRASVLLPEDGRREEEHSPTLLANALHGGRVRRRLRIEAAAGLLGIDQGELEAVELALICPEDPLLERICLLYSLPFGEMAALRQFGSAVPGTAKRLASLQQLFSRVHHMLKTRTPGEEDRLLGRIATLLESADSGSPIEPESSSEEVGLFLNRLSMHLVNALKDTEFRGKMFRMAGMDQGGDAPRRDAGTAMSAHMSPSIRSDGGV